MKLRSLTYLLALPLALSFLTLSSCKKDKDPTLTERLVGTWDVTSFTADGVELVGFLMQTFTMRFNEVQGGEGAFRWTIIYFDGSTEVTNGFYSVNEENESIRLEANGEVIRLDIDLRNNNSVVFSGNVDGESVVLRATRQ
jgi:hypothetical protein